jgi:APA family basic amino acid/polyamine antiporter
VELKPALGAWAAASIVVGTVIGSGIFLVPGDMVRAVGSPSMVFLVWIVGGALTLAGALTYAELSAALPRAGGEYAYLNQAYGPFFGFLYGWTQTWVAKPASAAALATGFYTYLADFFPALQTAAAIVPLPIGPGGGPLEIRRGQLAAIAVILVLAAVNYTGVRVGGGVQVAVTALKLALIAGVVAAGLLSGHASPRNLQGGSPPEGGVLFFPALVSALWAYDGWNNAGMLGSEIQRPQRNLPLALIGGTLAVIAVYLLANLAYFLVLGAPGVGAGSRVAADMMRRVAGEPGAAAVSAAALISIFAALNGSLLSGARVPYAMARDGYFFAPVARVHPRHRTPSASLLLLAVWASLLVLSGHYQELYTMAIFPSWILYAMAAAAVIVLRRRRPALARPYRVWGYPVVPAAFVAAAVLLLISTIRQSPRESGLGLGVILAGLPFYFHWKRGK